VSAFRAALVAFSAALLTAACAAGEHAATSEEKPSLDGTQGKVGSIQLEGVALHAPTKSSYSRGDDVGLAVYIANNGRSSDTLTKVTSPAFTGGWAVTSTGSPSATTSASPSSAATPQQIGAGAALGLGLTNLTPDGTGSPHSLVLKGLAASSAPLYPGSTVKITFSFARAGQTTLNVPVQITAQPNTQTLPANGASSG
jgi:copper(I)-binding protein